MRFSEVIGQNAMQQRLQKMAESGQMPHAIMLAGKDGYGTFPLALSLASYLLGQREEGTSANVEAMLNKCQHPDLHFSFPCIRLKKWSSDKKITSDEFMNEWQQMLAKGPYFSFQQWLVAIGAENQQGIIFEAEADRLNHIMSLRSSQGGYKIAIIWQPERMNEACANKLLKLIEEPPTQTVFIMVSEAPDKIIQTIRSRVQTIEVKPIDGDSLINALTTRRGIGSDDARRIAHIAAGDWFAAVQTLDLGNENRQFLDMFMMLMRDAYQYKVMNLKKWAEAVASFGREKQKRMLLYFSEQVRENFMRNFQRPEINYMNAEEEEFAVKFSRFINEKNIILLQELIDRTIKAIGQNANARIEFFDFTLNIIKLLHLK